MRKLRFGIVGCGRIAERHAAQIAQKGELIAVCDIIGQRADGLAQRYSAKAYCELEHLLKENNIDIISVCTPNGLHARHSIQALNAGFHVLCEKPMAIKVSDCRKMIEAAENAAKRLFIVKQNRYNPPVMAVKKAIDEGKLGKIYSLQLNCFWNRGAEYYGDSWRGTKQLDGGTLFTQFSHFIDLLYWMAGDVIEVQGMMANFAHQGIIEFEDVGVVNLQFAGGPLGSIHYTVNSYKRNMEGSLAVFGEKGTVKIGGQYLNELVYQEVEGFEFAGLSTGNKANDYGHYQGSMSNHDKVYENLVDVLQHNASMTTSAWEGLKTVEIVEKIYNTAIRL